MRYTIQDIFEGIGRRSHLDDEFQYPLNPNMRYIPAIVIEMWHEHEYRLQEYEVLTFDYRTLNIAIPRRRAFAMPIDTPELLQRALHHFCEEVNHIQMRLQWYNFRVLANERRHEGNIVAARLYLEAIRDEVQSDIKMSDDDEEPWKLWNSIRVLGLFNCVIHSHLYF